MIALAEPANPVGLGQGRIEILGEMARENGNREEMDAAWFCGAMEMLQHNRDVTGDVLHDVIVEDQIVQITLQVLCVKAEVEAPDRTQELALVALGGYIGRLITRADGRGDLLAKVDLRGEVQDLLPWLELDVALKEQLRNPRPFVGFAGPAPRQRDVAVVFEDRGSAQRTP